jgi:hypothetical protein
MKKQVRKLLKLAKKIMSESTDPIHDLAHVERVASYCKTISQSYNLSHSQYQALILAAWWHDAGRTITKRPSVIIMPFIDDTISALMLWRHTIRFGLFGSVAGMATRIIFCKSEVTGKFLKYIFLRKKNRILLEILEDADAIDMVHVDRANVIKEMVDSSYTYRLGYKAMVHWFMMWDTVRVQTEGARQLMINLFKKILEWIQQQEIFDWHIELLSLRVTQKVVVRIKDSINKLTLQPR